jgi:hypothetical protein
MNISCPNSIPYTQCPGSDSPITNYTAESPDQMNFIGTGYVPTNPWIPPNIAPPETVPNPPGLPPSSPPPSGSVVPPVIVPGESVYIYYDCNGVAISAHSQLEADLNAQLMSRFCAAQSPSSGYTPGVLNTAQAATVRCYAGQSFTFITTDGSFGGPP